MIGIIPAAGKAERMGGLPKFLLPIPGGTLANTLMKRVVLQMHMHSVRLPSKIWIGASRENAHLLQYRKDDYASRVTAIDTQTMSETVLRIHNIAASTYGDSQSVLFGMPDTYIEDEWAFRRIEHAIDDGADVAVGLFLTRPEQRSKLGMCDFDTTTQQITRVIDKPESTELVWAWGVLAWRHVFWDCLDANEPHVGYGILRAIERGLDVRAVRMEGGYWDCGTPEEYFSLIRYLTGEKVEA